MNEELQQLTSYLLNIEELRKARLRDADLIERLKKNADALEAALKNLANEVGGLLGLVPEGIRELVGNTNFGILMLRVDEARAVLAAIEKEREG